MTFIPPSFPLAKWVAKVVHPPFIPPSQSYPHTPRALHPPSEAGCTPLLASQTNGAGRPGDVARMISIPFGNGAGFRSRAKPNPAGRPLATDATMAAAIRDLAIRVDHLRPCHRNPHAFHEEKSEVVGELRLVAHQLEARR